MNGAGHTAPGHTERGNDMIANDSATTFITTHKGEDILVHLADGSTRFGTAFSVNSKGVNIKVDGKTVSISLSRIADLVLADAEVDGDDTDELEAIYAELHDGMTTTELAAALSNLMSATITPKELRVHLRALGLGVGKGRKYSLSASEFRSVRDLMTPAN